MQAARAPLESDDSVSQCVVEAVAEAEGVAPTELSPPLYEVVDPDALDRLFAPRPAPSGGRVVFSYNDYEVIVDAAGDVSVSAADA
ncbi:HalOD1 output domain-containing protein [Halorussus marinus]|uniref:HalOD1 output domain-containing protein n=1 Tax=Halorussus marinus TaxID=2505976 RepID=UPI0010928FA8|nr:HalOD1 output domain-containing protein [Halorussus marinus]